MLEHYTHIAALYIHIGINYIVGYWTLFLSIMTINIPQPLWLIIWFFLIYLWSTKINSSYGKMVRKQNDMIKSCFDRFEQYNNALHNSTRTRNENAELMLALEATNIQLMDKLNAFSTFNANSTVRAQQENPLASSDDNY